MIIERHFINTTKDKRLTSKKALTAMKEAAIVTFECDTIIALEYIGLGVYTVITGKRGF